MRILVCDPGASTSVADVRTGVVSALRRRGDVAVDVYELAGRLSAQGEYLRFMYRKAVKQWGKSSVPVPTPTDMVKRATYALPDAIWRHQADWVLFISGMFVHPDIFATLRWFGHTKTAMLLTESPYDDEQQKRVLPFADVAWTNERASIAPLRLVNPNTHYLRLAYNPSVHYPAPADAVLPSHDVVFVGTGFSERIELLAAVDWAGIDLGLYGNWQYLPPRHRLRQYIRSKEINNEAAVQLYRNAKIGLNLYRSSINWGKDAARLPAGYAESMNPRAYELAACGCFTLSDYRPEVPEMFGDLVPTFHDAAGLQSLVRQWLTDDVGRERVKAQLPEKVRYETWDRRVEQMLADMDRAGRGVA